MNQKQFDAIEVGQEVCTVTGPSHHPTRDLAAQVGEVIEKTDENGARYCLVRFEDGTEDTMHSYHELGQKGIGWYLLNDAHLCRVCMNRDAEMEFNLMFPDGLMCARICLTCWGLAGDDNQVAFLVVQRRKGWLAHHFPWYAQGMTMEEAIATHGREVVDQVNAFMLTEKKPK
jgi:hypothetical protein